MPAHLCPERGRWHRVLLHRHEWGVRTDRTGQDRLTEDVCPATAVSYPPTAILSSQAEQLMECWGTSLCRSVVWFLLSGWGAGWVGASVSESVEWVIVCVGGVWVSDERGHSFSAVETNP